MNNSENVPNINTAVDELTGHTTASRTTGQVELLQRLFDRVVYDVEERAARIRKEAELESAQLIKAVSWQAQEFVNKAQGQVEAVTKLEESLSVKVQEDIGKHTTGIVAKILDELLSSLDYVVEKAKALVVKNAQALEEELRTAAIVTGGEATSKACGQPEAAAEVNKAVSELHSELKEVIGSVDTAEVEASLSARTGETEVAVADETEATSEPKFPKEDAELFLGEVKIDIAPPVNAMRLLGLIRGLENIRGIRILGTAGSRNSGSVIALSLDKPLPLLTLLRDLPFVEGVTSAAEQSDVRRISVATRDGGCGTGKEG